MTETDLYPPLEEYLLSNGYSVHAEVKHADIIAKKDKQLIAVELKLRLNLTVILQAVDRLSAADSVYIGLPVPNKRNALRREKRLLRMLGLGLIFINPSAIVNKTVIIFHPGEYEIQKKNKNSILREISGRLKNFNTAGSTRTKLMTAYRQRAIHVACLLKKTGPASAAILKKTGGPADTGQILIKNYYGWFNRIKKGLYEIDKAGIESLKKYPELIRHFSKNLSKKKNN